MNESVRTITHAFEHSRVTGIGDDLLLRKKQPLRNLTLLPDNRHNLMPRPHEFICSPTANEATSSCHHNSHHTAFPTVWRPSHPPGVKAPRSQMCGGLGGCITHRQAHHIPHPAQEPG